MTDKSKFVLRWEIDNASTKLATGKAESEAFNEGGFKWTAAVERKVIHRSFMGQFSLRCGVDHKGPWKCEADVEFIFEGEKIYGADEDRCNVDDHNIIFRYHYYVNWLHMENRAILLDGNVTVEIRIHIISSESHEPIAHPWKFKAPHRMSNVILKIGDGRLHVSKELMALHSPVFEALFFGNFAENGKEEVELKDVDYREFVDLLNLIYHETFKIMDRTVPHILILADRFQMERMIVLAEEHLTQSDGLNVVKKLLLADQFRLVVLRNRCLNSFTSLDDMYGKLKSSPEYAHFSDAMKAAICDRGMKLRLHALDSNKRNVEFSIGIISSERGELVVDTRKFMAPNRKSNVILKIGDVRLHVYKELLALHSPVFDTLFFGNFAEKGKEEVELKDVDFKEFVDLLNLIYNETADIKDHMVPYILKLAFRFQMESMLFLAQQHLIHSDGVNVVKKLLLADQFRLVVLKDRCLNSFTSLADLYGKLKSTPEYAEFSDAMKVAICDQGMELASRCFVIE